jgi:hypothetical protein
MGVETNEAFQSGDRMSALLFAQLREAARRATLFELGVRQLADETDHLSGFAAEEELTRLVTRLIGHFSGRMSDGERELLPRCASMRDDLFSQGRSTEVFGADGFREMSLKFALAVQVLDRLRLDEA